MNANIRHGQLLAYSEPVRVERAGPMKHSGIVLILLAMLCLAFSMPIQAALGNGHAASGTVRAQETQTRISEAPDPATPFLVGAGLITLSVVIRRRRKLRSKESSEAKVNGREDS